MAVPADGKLPFDGAHPALIQWQPPHHPTQALPERNIRLTRLEIAHPQADALRAALASLTDPRIQITQGPRKDLRATFATPHGPRHSDMIRPAIAADAPALAALWNPWIANHRHHLCLHPQNRRGCGRDDRHPPGLLHHR